MAQPTAYTVANDFSQDEADAVGGRSTLRTAALDAELAGVATTLSETLANLALNQRDDGEIRDGRVKLFTLASDVLAMMVAFGGVPRGAWASGTSYALKDLAVSGGNTYVATLAHTSSGAFATDLAAGKWILFAIGTAPGASSVTFAPTATLAATNVQAAIEESDTETRAAVTTLRSDLASAAAANKGAGLSGFDFALNYASNTIGWAVKNALGANPLWFDAAGDGVADDTAAVQAAMNFSKTVNIPDGFVFRCTSGLTMNQAQQVIMGEGLSSEIRFALSSPGAGITTSNSAGQQGIFGVLLNGVSNVTKTISVGSPQLTIANSFVYNATSNGHCVYQEDENVGTNTYVFGLALLNVVVQGPGPANANTYGLRTGLNSQTSRVIGGAITDCSTLIYINGATSQLLIQGPILENCSDTEQAIYIHKAGSGMPCYEISILSTYFEHAHRCIVVGDCEPSGLTIRGCIASRNTSSSKGTSYFYLGSGSTLATTQNISIDENHVEDYGIFLGLGNEYSARLSSCRGNTTASVTSFSSGAFANKAYDVRVAAPSCGYLLESGAVIGAAVSRLESKNGVVTVPLPTSARETLRAIEFYTVSTGGNRVTVDLLRSELAGTTITVIGTVTSTADGTFSVGSVDGYQLVDGYTYYLRCTFNNAGTSSYLYPFKVYIYK